MIGQKVLQQKLADMVKDGKYPRFSILLGDKGSGRKTLAYNIAKSLEALPVVVKDSSAASVREVINGAYKNMGRCCYIFTDVDAMSVTAENALLKVTEEIPNDSFIIMTAESRDGVLNTVLSRAVVFRMENYSSYELSDFVGLLDVDKEEHDILIGLAQTPGDILRLSEIRVKDFNSYVEKVYNNIAEVSGANAFKIADKLSLKEGAEGYPLDLFLKAFMKRCSDEIMTLHQADEGSFSRNVAALRITSGALQDLKIKGINKKMLVDAWILSIREEWMD